MTHPTFGTRQAGLDYHLREGVYAIIPDEKKEQIILIQAPNGAWFLPGGEIEPGEDHLTALARELIEELGFTATIGPYLGQADEYFYSRHRDRHYYHPAYLYAVQSFEASQAPLEDFNQMAWFPIDEAIQHLKRGSHQWGVKAWQATL